MADHKSALKRNRQNIKRRAYNLDRRSGAKTAALKAVAAITKDAKGAVHAVTSAISVWAKAANKGSVPKRRAARKQSRLQRALNKALATAGSR